MGQMVSQPRWIRLKAWKDGASATALTAVEQAVHRVHGFCTDAHAFSNKAISVEFELVAGHIGEFRDALEQAGVHLAESSFVHLRQLAWEVPEDQEVDGMLYVELVHDEPERSFLLAY